MKQVGGHTTRAVLHGKPRFGLLVAQWYDTITRRLADGAREALREAGVPEKNIVEFEVPGSFELPQAARMLAESKKFDAIIPIGCLIRGETYHFELIAQVAARGLDEVGRTTSVPVSLALLTVDSIDQAMARCGGRYGNKGAEAAQAALSLLSLRAQVKKRGQ